MTKNLSGTLSELVVEAQMIETSISGLKSDINALKAISERSVSLKKTLRPAIAELNRMVKDDQLDLKIAMQKIADKQLSLL